MQLTEEQIQQETQWITEEERWPLWPILPVKRLGHLNEDESHGLMWSRHKNRIYLITLFDLRSGVNFEDRAKELNAKVLEFQTTEELVREGWVGD